MKNGLLLIFLFLFILPVINKNQSLLLAKETKSPASKDQARQLIKSQPVQFTENKGQMTDMDHQPVPFVLYKIQATGLDVYVTEKGLTYVFLKSEEEEYHAAEKSSMPVNQKEHTQVAWNRIDMTLQGASVKKENTITEGTSKNFSQYFLAYCTNGIKDVHSFQKIIIKNIYPNIDWILYNSSEQGFKYDFVVHPGADYKQIELVYSSSDAVQLDASGNVIIKTNLGILTENAPTSFLNGKQITSHFIKRVHQKNRENGIDSHIEFSIPDATNSKSFNTDLVIDPQLTWATFIGGASIEGAVSITTDSSDNVFVTGYTLSTDFPTLDAGSYYQGTHGGGFYDAFILKFNNSGLLLWATYYGGDGSDTGNSIAIDATGNVFLTGITSSGNLPVLDAGTFFQGTNAGAADIFVSKFDNLGNFIWGTYYGGTESEGAYSIATDISGNLFITGYTLSPDFPTQDAGTFFQGIFAGATPPSGDVFILKFDNAGTRLWSTYYGGTLDELGYSVAIDATNNVCITGSTSSTDFPVQDAGTFFQGTFGGGIDDAFILKFDNSGNRLWATYFGGTLEDQGRSILTDASGNVFVTGNTRSLDFPVVDAGTFFQVTNAGNNDIFISRFNNTCTLTWSTFYGGIGYELSQPFDNLAIDRCGNIYVSFQTDFSASIHTQTSCDAGYNDSTYNGDFSDIFLTMFTNSGNLLWATYLGGDGPEDWSPLAIDKKNNLFVAGGLRITDDTTFPLTDPGGGAYYDDSFNGSRDAILVKFTPMPITTTVTDAGCNCSGTATALMVGTCYRTYLWSDGQTTPTAVALCPGIYNVVVTDTVMCNTQTATVNIDSSDIAITVNSPAICAGDTALLTAAGATTYTWSAGAVASGASTAIAFPTATSTYTLTGVTGTCSDTAIAAVTVNPLPVITVNSPVICVGDNAILVASGATAYTWSTTETGSIITVTPSITSAYNVVGSAAGCFDTATAIVTVTPLPVAGVNADTTIITGSVIQLVANGGTGYSWSPSTGLSCTDCPAPFVSPVQTTTYCVTVNNGLCNDEACVTVHVEMPCAGVTEFNVPNAFSPDNDGNNDDFLLQGWSDCMKEFSIVIYNRWGEKVFESDNVSFKWNGIYKGKVLDPAVFVYYITAKLYSDIPIEQKGNITLIR